MFPCHSISAPKSDLHPVAVLGAEEDSNRSVSAGCQEEVPDSDWLQPLIRAWQRPGRKIRSTGQTAVIRGQAAPHEVSSASPVCSYPARRLSSLPCLLHAAPPASFWFLPHSELVPLQGFGTCSSLYLECSSHNWFLLINSNFPSQPRPFLMAVSKKSPCQSLSKCPFLLPLFT